MPYVPIYTTLLVLIPVSDVTYFFHKSLIYNIQYNVGGFSVIKYRNIRA